MSQPEPIVLPGITAPEGTPVFFVLGHSIVESNPHGVVKMARGHSRTRRLRTKPERTVSVQWQLEADQMGAVIDWYEETLKAGAEPFSAHVAAEEQGGLVYWWARWKTFSTEMQHLGRGRVSGEIFLRGDASADPPNTSSLRMEVRAALRSIPGSIVGNSTLAMEVGAALVSIQTGS
jgi:hypothetical protein